MGIFGAGLEGGDVAGMIGEVEEEGEAVGVVGEVVVETEVGVGVGEEFDFVGAEERGGFGGEGAGDGVFFDFPVEEGGEGGGPLRTPNVQ